MLVEDDRTTLLLTAQLLVEQGWLVDQFSDPLEAQRALSTAEYAVGVFDIMMTGITGVQLLAHVRSMQHTMDVILITAFPQLQTAIDAVQLGASDYLRKPFEPEELIRVVKRTLVHRALRLESAELTSKLETLQSIASAARADEALEVILAEAIAGAASTMSSDYLYFAFLEMGDLEPVFVGLDTPGTPTAAIEKVKPWLDAVTTGVVGVSDIAPDLRPPLLALMSTKAVLYAPIVSRHSRGAIVCCAPQRGVFKSHDERFFVTTSSLLGLAAERVASIEELRYRRLEEQRRLAEYVRAVAGAAAHDLRNPIAIISGRAESALSYVDLQSPVGRDLKVIHEQSVRADERMNALLDFCYNTERKVRDICDLSTLVLETQETVSTERLREDVDVTVVPSPPAGLLDCDPLRVQQALRNVIVNAVRASVVGGTVTIAVSSGQGFAHIRVHNVGPSIPETRWEELFTPQIGSAGGGCGNKRTGYGLPIARGIIRNHGGDVFIEASDAHGTTFVLSLPLLRQDAADQSLEATF